jgi:flavin reductase (DIM6/NTAB) family NADH-FMN oxidoreductase RutF
MSTLSERLADPESVKSAMRHWVAGVTIVTSFHEGIQHGMTVSSFTSISLVPPMILVSMANDTRTHWLVSISGVFGVTILETNQSDISERFAGRKGDEENRFAGIETETLISGAPFIRGGLAYIDCRVVNRVAAGTSTVFLGEILEARSRQDGVPLVYSNRTYFKLQK